MEKDMKRKLALKKQTGSIPNTGDSVKEIRELRKKLSKEKFDLDEINKLAELRPEYIEKAKKIMKQKPIKVGTLEDFRKRYGIKMRNPKQ